MHKRPLAVIAIFFIFGIVLARFLPESVKFFHVFIVTLIFIGIFFILSRNCHCERSEAISKDEIASSSLDKLGTPRNDTVANIFLLLSITSFATLLYINSNTFPNNHIRHVLGEEKLKTEIIGVIKSPVLTRKPYYGKISSTYLFEIEQIVDRSVSGLAQIRIQTERDYQYGDRLRVKGTIRRPAQPVIASEAKQSQKKEIASSSAKKHDGLLAMTRSEFNYSEYLERQNIFALINTKEHGITVLARDYKSNPILKYTYILREKLKNQIIEKMPLESGAFMRAILLGDRSELPEHVQAAFKNSGTMHMLAISGLHIGLIAAVMLCFFRLLRIKREFSYTVTMLLLIFFALLTLLRPSVVRAVIMAGIFLIGLLLGRKVDAYNTLGAAALFIMVENPDDLFNVGFQLSFLAVLCIVFLTPRLTALAGDNANLYAKRYVYTPLAVSMAAWLGTFPLIACYFRIITPVAVIANLFIIPLLFIVLIGGIGFLLLGWVPFAGETLAFVNNLCAGFIFSLADFFASFKFGHFYI